MIDIIKINSVNIPNPIQNAENDDVQINNVPTCFVWVWNKVS
jgi:hypothetical protein